MSFNEELAARVTGIIRNEPHMSSKMMFGGLGVMIGGNMACGVIGDDLIIRMSPEDYDEAILHDGVREFDFTGKPMRGWVFIDGATVADDDVLSEWVTVGADFANSLPAK